MKNYILFLLLLIFPAACFSKEVSQDSAVSSGSNVSSPSNITQKIQPLSECEKAGGILSKLQECDGSESDWCNISEREACYADQVKDGKCTAGYYSEELGGVVGISPRVLCDNLQ